VREESDVGTHEKSSAPISVGSAADTGATVPAPPETHTAADDHPTTPPPVTNTPPPVTNTPPPVTNTPPPVTNTPPPPTQKVVTAPPTTTTPKAGQPAIVPPGAVHRVSGSLPTIDTQPRAGETPPSKISTMLCIDTSGNVTTVKILTKGLPGTVPSDLQNAMSGWKYQPYKQGPNAAPACFVVSFAVKWPDSARGN
jgi:hypothetical protein